MSDRVTAMRRRKPALCAGYDRYDSYDRYFPYIYYHFFIPPRLCLTTTHPLIISIIYKYMSLCVICATTPDFIGASEMTDIWQMWQIPAVVPDSQRSGTADIKIPGISPGGC